MMSSRLLFLILLGAVFPLTGCILVPIPTGEHTVLAGKPVTEEQLSFLARKHITKEEVIGQLGHPNVIWEDARVFVYQWDMRQGILFWAVGGALKGAAGLADIPRHYLLLIQFDEQDRVRRSERLVVPSFKTHAEFLREWVRQSDAQASPDLREREQ
ncbi:MAG: hypothetical protein Q8L95_05110 [Burkholderiales bacterium]|nr:hypothetical protein [Burkholderiales bacterium]